MTSPLKTFVKRNEARRNRPIVVNIRTRSTRLPSGDPRLDLTQVMFR